MLLKENKEASRTWSALYPGVRTKYMHNKHHSFLVLPQHYPLFSLIPRSKLSLSSHNVPSLLSDCLHSSNHLLPSALFWYCTIVYCSHIDSLTRSLQPLVKSLSPSHPLYSETGVERSTIWISQVQLSDSLSPSQQLPAFLISKENDLLGSSLKQGKGLGNAYWSPRCVHSLSLRSAQIAQLTPQA